MSTPTKQDDRHEIIEVKPDQGEETEAKPVRNEEPWRSVWWWTTFEIPKKPLDAVDFFGIIFAILVLECIFGFIIGSILRSIFGWPF